MLEKKLEYLYTHTKQKNHNKYIKIETIQKETLVTRPLNFTKS